MRHVDLRCFSKTEHHKQRHDRHELNDARSSFGDACDSLAYEDAR